MALSEYERARERVLWYLDRSDRTEKELRDRLRRGGFEQGVCDEVLARLCEVGVVDDRRYALRFAERCMEANISRRQTYAKLLAKGISRELANEALDANETDEVAQVKAVIAKKYALKLADPENTQKVYAALIRKGFSYVAVRDALKEYSEELEYSGEEYV